MGRLAAFAMSAIVLLAAVAAFAVGVSAQQIIGIRVSAVPSTLYVIPGNWSAFIYDSSFNALAVPTYYIRNGYTVAFLRTTSYDGYIYFYQAGSIPVATTEFWAGVFGTPSCYNGTATVVVSVSGDSYNVIPGTTVTYKVPNLYNISVVYDGAKFNVTNVCSISMSGLSFTISSSYTSAPNLGNIFTTSGSSRLSYPITVTVYAGSGSYPISVDSIVGSSGSENLKAYTVVTAIITYGNPSTGATYQYVFKYNLLNGFANVGNLIVSSNVVQIPVTLYTFKTYSGYFNGRLDLIYDSTLRFNITIYPPVSGYYVSSSTSQVGYYVTESIFSPVSRNVVYSSNTSSYSVGVGGSTTVGGVNVVVVDPSTADAVVVPHVVTNTVTNTVTSTTTVVSTVPTTVTSNYTITVTDTVTNTVTNTVTSTAYVTSTYTYYSTTTVPVTTTTTVVSTVPVATTVLYTVTAANATVTEVNFVTETSTVYSTVTVASVVPVVSYETVTTTATVGGGFGVVDVAIAAVVALVVGLAIGIAVRRY